MKDDLNRHLSPKEKLAHTRLLAESGDAEAQYQVGFRYYLGDSGAQDFNAAERWYAQAAAQGHTEAQFKLGKMKAQGRGIDRNTEEAVQWLTRAADAGHAEACELLGDMHREGLEGGPDMVASHRWYQRALAAHDAELSDYLKGEGLDPALRGPALAAALFDAELAAELEVGLDRAQARLAAIEAGMTPEAVAEARRPG